jgi:hypothetical protein
MQVSAHVFILRYAHDRVRPLPRHSRAGGNPANHESNERHEWGRLRAGRGGRKKFAFTKVGGHKRIISHGWVRKEHGFLSTAEVN